jgi:polysaccharide deacetylase 2 family uncharacterized protein YibQ
VSRRNIRKFETKKSGVRLWFVAASILFLGLGILVIELADNRDLFRNKAAIEVAVAADSSISPQTVKIDNAIRLATVDLGVPAKSVSWKKSKQNLKQKPSNITINVNSAFPMSFIDFVLQRAITDAGGKILDVFETKPDQELLINIGETNLFFTHQIKVKRRADAPLESAYVAILMDDFGNYAVPVAARALKLGIPFTASVLPNAEYSTLVVKELDKYPEIERFAHIPMEPKSFPKDDPGLDAILTTLDDREILEKTKKAIESVPKSVGANNHMGSKATESKRVMYQVLKSVQNAGMFWVDSRTTIYSVAPDVCAELKIPILQIDYVLDPPTITYDQSVQRLYDYALSARRKPAVIINCHCVDTTIEILAGNVAVLKKLGVSFIPVSKAKERICREKTM